MVWVINDFEIIVTITENNICLSYFFIIHTNKIIKYTEF